MAIHTPCSNSKQCRRLLIPRCIYQVPRMSCRLTAQDCLELVEMTETSSICRMSNVTEKLHFDGD